MSRAREHDWLIGIAAGLLALAALVVGSESGTFHGSALHPRLVSWIAAAVLLVAGIVATRRIAAGLGNLAPLRSNPAAGAEVRLLATGVGYVILVFAMFAVLGVSIARLLIGAGLIGIVVGIAAQQSLGNIFASLVLLLARPFGVGDRIRIRSGALGGVFDVSVLGISLTYVTVRTDEGEMKIPNSAMLAAGVGRLPSVPGTPVPPPDEVAAPRDKGGDSVNPT